MTPTEKRKFYRKVGMMLRAFRIIAGKTQTELSVVLGVDQSRVSHLEDGTGDMSAVELFAAAAFLGVQPEQILYATPIYVKNEKVRKKLQKYQVPLLTKKSLDAQEFLH